jgi:hypothetical protein
MIPDPTEVIREIRRKLSAEFGNDLHRIAEETRRRQRESGRKIVAPPERHSADLPLPPIPAMPNLQVPASTES